MSAEAIFDERTEQAAPPRLRLVQAPTATVSALGFVGIVALLIVAGLGGVMFVTTSVGAQSRELTALRNQASLEKTIPQK